MRDREALRNIKGPSREKLIVAVTNVDRLDYMDPKDDDVRRTQKQHDKEQALQTIYLQLRDGVSGNEGLSGFSCLQECRKRSVAGQVATHYSQCARLFALNTEQVLMCLRRGNPLPEEFRLLETAIELAACS